MLLNDKVYDRLKWITMIFLPASSTAYFTLSSIWGFPHAEQVVGTLAVIMTFSGALLGISTATYNNSEQRFDGIMHVDTHDPTKDLYTFELYEAPEELPEKDHITFKVSNNTP